MKNILIVDDQPDVPIMLTLILQDEDRQFITAQNGAEALAIARRGTPDLILLDIMMPGKINGLEVAKTLKDDPATSRCPIIIMTAKVQKKDREEAFASGADDYVGKPFKWEEVKEKVNKYLTEGL